jgi:hypothetical protein
VGATSEELLQLPALFAAMELCTMQVSIARDVYGSVRMILGLRTDARI